LPVPAGEGNSRNTLLPYNTEETGQSFKKDELCFEAIQFLIAARGKSGFHPA
jgi:hypothetical protein